MGDKIQMNRVPTGFGQDRLHLRRVAMATDLVSLKRLVYVAEMGGLVGTAPCPADTRFGVGNEQVGIDQVALIRGTRGRSKLVG